MAVRIRRWATGREPGADASLAEVVLFRLRLPLLAMFTLFSAASLAYALVEGFGWLDAAYMTVITLSTVGFR